MSVLTLLFLSTALGAAPAAGADGLSLALIVANNRSAQLGRPPLQYAAMDGAKYHELFASFLGEENTVLLTDLDRDTARLFPGLVASARSPTRANVDEAVRSLARRAAEARRAGRLVRFYFAFAGHGDVDKGRGFLELIDGPFTSDDLDALLRRIGASEAHVILDSCNSFFVVNPRRPGGRRFGTPRDAAENLARRLPNVGVFLSTSAEAEVYEWSELQSGVFSHAVRSGLMGAADARHNGRITYQELAAFLDTASAEIKNPLFRPRALAAYLEERSREPEPVYGISREEAERMGLLLAQLADSERQRRRVRATTAFTIGAAGAVYFGLAARDQSLTSKEKIGFGLVAGLIPAVAVGLFGRCELTKESSGERLNQRFRAATAAPGADQAQIAAETEASLQGILEDERRARTTKLILGWAMTGLGTAGLVANEVNMDNSHDARIIGRGYAVVFTGAFLAMTLSEQFSTSPTEKLIDLWMKDPDRARAPSLSLAPVPGGGMVALSG
jgi:hypothetical protein